MFTFTIFYFLMRKREIMVLKDMSSAIGLRGAPVFLLLASVIRDNSMLQLNRYCQGSVVGGGFTDI